MQHHTREESNVGTLTEEINGFAGNTFVAIESRVISCKQNQITTEENKVRGELWVWVN